MRKKIIIGTLFIVFCSIIYFTNSLQFKFFIEIIKMNKTLPTISSDFYNEPIEDITYNDVVYKTRDNKELTLDIYKSNKDDKLSPVLIYVFGNGWTEGSNVIPQGIKPIIDLLNAEGYTIISTSYELMTDEIIFDEQISDIKDTIRWVYKNKDLYNFDTSNIGLIGPSAGAQLSMVAAYSNSDDFIGDITLSKYPCGINYIIDLFGPSLLSDINLDSVPSKYKTLLKEEFIDELSEKYSPINYLKENLPNTLIIHSKSDNLIPYESSVEFYNAALEYGNDFKFLTLNDCTHYLENLSETEALNLYMAIVNFIVSQNN